MATTINKVLLCLLLFVGSATAQPERTMFFSLNTNKIDEDAKRYIDTLSARGETLDATKRNGLNAFFRGLKTNGFWDSTYSIQFTVYNTANKNTINLKTAQTLGSIVNTVTYGTSGLKGNGSSSYFNTGVSPSAMNVNFNNFSYVVVCTENPTIGLGNSAHFGTRSGLESANGYPNTIYGTTYRSGGTLRFVSIGRDGREPIQSSISDGRVRMIGTRTSSTSAAMYVNGSSVATNSGTNTIPTTLSAMPILLGVLNQASPGSDSGTPTGYNDYRFAFFMTIKQGLNATQAAALDTLIANLLTAFGVTNL